MPTKKAVLIRFVFRGREGSRLEKLENQILALLNRRILFLAFCLEFLIHSCGAEGARASNHVLELRRQTFP